MLEFSKNILRKVSFDKRLFRKELRKAIKWSNREERLALQAWCVLTFGHMYGDIITDCFTQVVL